MELFDGVHLRVGQEAPFHVRALFLVAVEEAQVWLVLVLSKDHNKQNVQASKAMWTNTERGEKGYGFIGNWGVRQTERGGQNV